MTDSSYNSSLINSTTNNTAPLSYKATTNLKNSLATGAISGYGNSNTNELGEIAGNVGKNLFEEISSNTLTA